jgi:hypothetical protein
MLIISCHSDTNFSNHSLVNIDDDTVFGHLDNFAGVYSVMQAYFSGRINQDYVRIELTYGEEDEYQGAYEVLETLNEHDVVIVVDVTGTETQGDFVIEKCRTEELQDFMRQALDGMEFDMYEDCPDPVADEDETDVYSQKCTHVCFVGIPCFGGDYNDDPVYCRRSSMERLSEAICRIVEYYPVFAEQHQLPE